MVMIHFVICKRNKQESESRCRKCHVSTAEAGARCCCPAFPFSIEHRSTHTLNNAFSPRAFRIHSTSAGDRSRKKRDYVSSDNSRRASGLAREDGIVARVRAEYTPL